METKIGWQKIVEKKRKALAALIPEKWCIPPDQLPKESERSVISFVKENRLLTDEELTITELTVQELIEKITAGEYTAVQVCQAYCHRAAIAHQLVNCLSEIYFDNALEQAKELDAYFQKHGKTIGLLHGVPVSLKDQFRVKGLESAIGYVGWLGIVDQEESVLTECLRKAGAIIYVKTAVPQTLMVGETINNIGGRTLNPYNRLLSCGGSSGGEGALIALHGSPLGVGTDVGGSVRIPASFNHLCGLKPSHERLPLTKLKRTVDGEAILSTACGLMAHCVTDLVCFMRAVLQVEPWDHDLKMIKMPWQETKYVEGKTGKKVFGVIVTEGIFGFDGYIMPHPPVLRGIQMVITALKKAGHTVVEWEPYKHKYAYDLYKDIQDVDRGESIKRAIASSDEPTIINVKKKFVSNLPPVDDAACLQFRDNKCLYQKEYAEYWQQRAHVDGWILPVAPHAAIKHDHYKYYGYTIVINVLNWPAVTIPVTFANKDIDIKNIQYESRNHLDAIIYDEYDADIYDGAPVGVQVVGKHLQEEYVLGLAEKIGEALHHSE